MINFHSQTHTHTSNTPEATSDLAQQMCVLQKLQEQEKPDPGSYLKVTSRQPLAGIGWAASASPPCLYLLFNWASPFSRPPRLPEGGSSARAEGFLESGHLQALP